MKNIIGFATQFYTLWSFENEEIYFTDSRGNHHLSAVKTNYYYHKNISKDLNIVKSKYPDLTIDENVRGKHSDFSSTKQIDIPANIFNYGKHYGKTIEDVCKEDFSYILWFLENGSDRICQEIKKLKIVIDYFEEIERIKNEKMNSLPEYKSGNVELTFQRNPNHKFNLYQTYDEYYINEHKELDVLKEHDGKYYILSQTDDLTLYLIIDEIKEVGGLYPYNMAMLNGKFVKTKEKTFNLNIEIIYTSKSEYQITQFAILK